MTPLKELAPAVAFVSGFATTKDPTAPSAFIWCKSGRVRAFSGASGAVWDVPAKTPEFVVQAAGLASLLTSLASQHKEVDLKVTEARLVVKAGSSRAQIPLWPRDVDAPREWFERDAPDGGVAIDTDFWAAVARVKPSASVDEAKPALRGVYWSDDGTLVATDNVRVTVCRQPLASPVAGGVLVPIGLLSQVGAAPGFTHAVADERSVWFMTDAGAVYGQLLAAPYPAKPLMDLVEKRRREGGTRVTLSDGQSDVAAAIGRLLAFSKKQDTVRVDAQKSAVRLWVAESDGDGRSAEELVRATVDGDPFECAVSGKMLRDALGVSATFTHVPKRPLYFSNDAGLEQIVSLTASS